MEKWLETNGISVSSFNMVEADSKPNLHYSTDSIISFHSQYIFEIVLYSYDISLYMLLIISHLNMGCNNIQSVDKNNI